MNLNSRSTTLWLNLLVGFGMGFNALIGCNAVRLANKYQHTQPVLEKESFIALLEATNDAWQVSVTVSTIAFFVAAINVIFLIQKDQKS